MSDLAEIALDYAVKKRLHLDAHFECEEWAPAEWEVGDAGRPYCRAQGSEIPEEDWCETCHKHRASTRVLGNAWRRFTRHFRKEAPR